MLCGVRNGIGPGTVDLKNIANAADCRDGNSSCDDYAGNEKLERKKNQDVAIASEAAPLHVDRKVNDRQEAQRRRRRRQNPSREAFHQEL